MNKKKIALATLTALTFIFSTVFSALPTVVYAEEIITETDINDDEKSDSEVMALSANTVDPSKGYGGVDLPAAPIKNGDVWTVTPENAQYTLDGAYGYISGKTIHFSSGK